VDLFTRSDQQFSRYKQSLLDQALLRSPLYQQGNLTYYEAYFRSTTQTEYIDASFVIHYQKQALVLVQICETVKGVSSYYGLPILFNWRADASAEERKGGFKLVLKTLQRIWGRAEAKTTRISYLDPCEGPLSEFSLYLLKDGFAPVTEFRQVIDLQNSQQVLLTDVRKNYRADIRWGEKNMTFQLFDHSTITPEIMEQFRQLHIQVSGKETRSKQTWLAQYDFVKSGEGFVLFGFLDGELVATGLFIHNQTTCYYGVGAYCRDRFDKPISHALVWMALLHAKQIGCEQFDFGSAYFPDRSGGNDSNRVVTDKEIAISRFKQGFGGEIRSQLLF